MRVKEQKKKIVLVNEYTDTNVEVALVLNISSLKHNYGPARTLNVLFLIAANSWESSRITLNELKERTNERTIEWRKKTDRLLQAKRFFDVITQLVYNDDINEYCLAGFVYMFAFVLGVPDAHTTFVMLTLSRSFHLLLLWFCFGSFLR